MCFPPQIICFFLSMFLSTVFIPILTKGWKCDLVVRHNAWGATPATQAPPPQVPAPQPQVPVANSSIYQCYSEIVSMSVKVKLHGPVEPAMVQPRYCKNIQTGARVDNSMCFGTDNGCELQLCTLWRTKKSHFQASVEMGMKNVDKDAVNTTIGLLCYLVALIHSFTFAENFHASR